MKAVIQQIGKPLRSKRHSELAVYWKRGVACLGLQQAYRTLLLIMILPVYMPAAQYCPEYVSDQSS